MEKDVGILQGRTIIQNFFDKLEKTHGISKS